MLFNLRCKVTLIHFHHSFPFSVYMVEVCPQVVILGLMLKTFLRTNMARKMQHFGYRINIYE